MPLRSRSINLTNISYQGLLADVVRYQNSIAEGSKNVLTDQPQLAPAAEEALRDLTARAALDLGMSYGSAREALLYAARIHDAPLNHTLLHAAAQLRLREQ